MRRGKSTNRIVGGRYARVNTKKLDTVGERVAVTLRSWKFESCNTKSLAVPPTTLCLEEMPKAAPKKPAQAAAAKPVGVRKGSPRGPKERCAS